MRFLLKIVVQIQGLVRGFLQRNAFYKSMKDNGYKPSTDIIRKRFIGYKLGRISKKHIDNMSADRVQFLSFIKNIDANIESTEKLLLDFMPNISRIMQEKQDRKAKQQP